MPHDIPKLTQEFKDLVGILNETSQKYQRIRMEPKEPSKLDENGSVHWLWQFYASLPDEVECRTTPSESVMYYPKENLFRMYDPDSKSSPLDQFEISELAEVKERITNTFS
jgi:hypothetical protein